MHQCFNKLITNAFRCNQRKARRLRFHGLPRLFLDFKIEHGGKSHRPHQAQVVFAKARLRFSDGPDHASRQVGLTADIIEHPPLHWIEKKPVDRKITALRILHRGRKPNSIRMASIAIVTIFTKGGYLKRMTTRPHDDDTKVGANRQTVGKKRHHNRRQRTGGNVVIVRLHSAQKIAHTTARKHGFMAMLAQAPDDFFGMNAHANTRPRTSPSRKGFV